MKTKIDNKQRPRPTQTERLIIRKSYALFYRPARCSSRPNVYMNGPASVRFTGFRGIVVGWRFSRRTDALSRRWLEQSSRNDFGTQTCCDPGILFVFLGRIEIPLSGGPGGSTIFVFLNDPARTMSYTTSFWTLNFDTYFFLL